MISKYYYKRIWIYWVSMIPLLIIYYFLVVQNYTQDYIIMDALITIFVILIIIYIFNISILKKPAIILSDYQIEYYYLIKRKILFADIEQMDIILHYNSKKLSLKTYKGMKYKILLDGLSADADTIIKDFKNRFDKQRKYLKKH